MMYRVEHDEFNLLHVRLAVLCQIVLIYKDVHNLCFPYFRVDSYTSYLLYTPLALAWIKLWLRFTYNTFFIAYCCCDVRDVFEIVKSHDLMR